jgi:hypothetical protein
MVYIRYLQLNFDFHGDSRLRMTKWRRWGVVVALADPCPAQFETGRRKLSNPDCRRMNVSALGSLLSCPLVVKRRYLSGRACDVVGLLENGSCSQTVQRVGATLKGCQSPSWKRLHGLLPWLREPPISARTTDAITRDTLAPKKIFDVSFQGPPRRDL